MTQGRKTGWTFIATYKDEVKTLIVREATEKKVLSAGDEWILSNTDWPLKRVDRKAVKNS